MCSLLGRGDRPGDPRCWDDFEFAAGHAKDPEIREIIDELVRSGGWLDPPNYADDPTAEAALRTCAYKLRCLQAKWDSRDQDRGPTR